MAAVDSPQREGTRAWHAHIGLEQSNVARVERADLLVLLVVFVVDDRTSSHVSLRQGVGSVVEARGSSAAEKAAADRSVRCLPPEHGGPRPRCPSPIRALGIDLPS